MPRGHPTTLPIRPGHGAGTNKRYVEAEAREMTAYVVYQPTADAPPRLVSIRGRRCSNQLRLDKPHEAVGMRTNLPLAALHTSPDEAVDAFIMDCLKQADFHRRQSVHWAELAIKAPALIPPEAK